MVLYLASNFETKRNSLNLLLLSLSSANYLSPFDVITPSFTPKRPNNGGPLRIRGLEARNRPRHRLHCSLLYAKLIDPDRLFKKKKKSDPTTMKNNTVVDSIRGAEILLKALDGGIDGQTADFEGTSSLQHLAN
ncbi:hypothetical protein K0M31_002493 [Melipona bicolor]|uniref:Uncharacterized protein n=1 Tax=Melipona bicolor TaxID=60889 RepID=A0AA40KZ74_9HYME|nr:hypothetical protein K0M31_002493 [Melipona bicolor]